MGHDKELPECSSPPCFLHEVDPAYSGLGTQEQAHKAKRRGVTGSGKRHPAGRPKGSKGTASK